MWAIYGNVIKTPTRKVREFSLPVSNSLEINNTLIFTLQPNREANCDRNLFCIREDGKLAWQIEYIVETNTDPINHYVGVVKLDNGNILAGNWNGMQIELNPCTGAVVSKKEGR